MLISIIVTARNEERNIGHLLDGLVNQEQPIEIVVVDAGSTDSTRDIVREYMSRYGFIRLLEKAGTRGRSRNYAVERSEGEAVAFIDADCIANPFWIRRMRTSLGDWEVVAGKTINIGYQPFEDLERVELIYRGFDITFPSNNLAYRRSLFNKIGGFDDWFVTAEDIDLNLRAVEAGARIYHEEEAIVYHRTRPTFYRFYEQAFWNGAGRKQLTLKHGGLWRNYRPFEMFKREANLWSLTRLVVALLGYAGYKFFGRRESTQNQVQSDSMHPAG
ncbi:MAG: glycosyltransferase [Thermoplasmata archaeon]